MFVQGISIYGKIVSLGTLHNVSNRIFKLSLCKKRPYRMYLEPNIKTIETVKMKYIPYIEWNENTYKVKREIPIRWLYHFCDTVSIKSVYLRKQMKYSIIDDNILERSEINKKEIVGNIINNMKNMNNLKFEQYCIDSYCMHNKSLKLKNGILDLRRLDRSLNKKYIDIKTGEFNCDLWTLVILENIFKSNNF